MYKRMFVWALLVVTLLSGALAVTAQDMVDRESVGGRLVLADASADVSLDPFVTSWHVAPHAAIYANLFAKTEQLEYVGYLADTWEVSEDNKSLTITLLDYATFSDGTSVNAEAIKWNLDRFSDPEATSSTGASLRGLLINTEVLDEYVIRLDLDRPYASLIFDLAFLEIVSPTAYEIYGVDEFGLNPVGAGPFVLKEYVSGSHYLMERRDDMTWLPEEIYENTGPVYLEELEVRFVDDELTVLAGLETGEFHFAAIPAQNLQDMMDNDAVYVHQQMQNMIRYVGFNTSKAPWDDAELRRAISYAINRVDYAALVFDDLATPLYQPLPPTIWGHNPDLDADSYHYDPERSMAMLDALGYVDVDGDGMRENPDGEAWAVPLNAVAGQTEQTRGAQVVEANLLDVGIPVQVELLEQQELIDLTTTGTHDLFLLWYGYTDPTILSYFFDPHRIGGSNRAHYVNDDLANLLIEANSELVPEMRFETIQEINTHIIDNAPWIFLVVPENIFGVHESLVNWRIHPEGYLLYWNAYFELGG